LVVCIKKECMASAFFIHPLILLFSPTPTSALPVPDFSGQAADCRRRLSHNPHKLQDQGVFPQFLRFPLRYGVSRLRFWQCSFSDAAFHCVSVSERHSRPYRYFSARGIRVVFPVTPVLLSCGYSNCNHRDTDRSPGGQSPSLS